MMNPAPSVPSAGDGHDVSAPTAGRSQPQPRGKKTTGTIAKRACDQCKFRKIKVCYGSGWWDWIRGLVLTGAVQLVATLSRVSVDGL